MRVKLVHRWQLNAHLLPPCRNTTARWWAVCTRKQSSEACKVVLARRDWCARGAAIGRRLKATVASRAHYKARHALSLAASFDGT